jgi:menaquinone-dependent protoporphyrinogen IX oxidase
MRRSPESVMACNAFTSRDHEYTDWQALDRFADELALLVDKGDANR